MKKLFEKIKKSNYKKVYALSAILVLLILIIPSFVEANVIADGLFAISGIAANAISTVLKTIFEMIMWICASLVYLSGLVLDRSIAWTIQDFAKITSNTGMVGIGWTIFRDLSNIVFIFLVLWIAISTILGLSHDAPMSSILRIAVAAILVNFSLLITKTVIDVSNIVALHFYNLITANGQGSFAGVFMQGMYLNTIYDAKGIDWKSAAIDGKITMIFAFGSVAMLIAAWSFLAAAVMFLIRSLYLIVLMILSPFAFIAWVVGHNFGHLTHEWWSKLFKQAFFAPIFMIIVYIVGKTIQTQGSGGLFGVNLDGQSVTKMVEEMSKGTTDTTVVSIVFNFFMIVGMMIAALISSNKLGAVGSETAIHWGNKIRGAGQSWVGGWAIGRPARWVNEKLEESYIGNTAVGKWFRDNVTTKAMHAKFGGEMSGEERYEEALELEARRHEALEVKDARGLLKNIKIAETNGISELEKADNSLDEMAKDPKNTPDDIAKAKAARENLKKNIDADLDRRRKELQQVLVKLTPHAFEEMVPEDFLYDKEFMRNVSRSQFMKVLGSDHYSETQKMRMREARYGLIADAKMKVDERNKGYMEKHREYLEEIQKISPDVVAGLTSRSFGNDPDVIAIYDEFAKAKTEEEKALIVGRFINNKTDKVNDYLKSLGKSIKVPKKPKKFMIGDVAPDVRAWMRAMADSEVDEMYRLNPDMVTDPTVAMTLRSSVTRYMRQSESVASIDKDKMRDSKFRDMIDAEDLVDGFGEVAPTLKTFQHMLKKLVDSSPDPDEARKKLSKLFDINTQDQYEEIEKSPEKWEEIKELYLRKQVKEVAMHGNYDAYRSTFNEEQKAMSSVLGDERMIEAISGKSPDEYGLMRGSRWRAPSFTSYMNRSNGKDFSGKDTGDIQETATMVLHGFKKYLDGAKSSMSRENIDLLHWVFTENNGKNFINKSLLSEDLQKVFEKAEKVFNDITRNGAKTQEKLDETVTRLKASGTI